MAGVLIIGERSYDAGSWIRIEAGEVFTPLTKDAGCEVFCVYSKGYEKVAPANT
jgi:hypothetical protein